MFMKYKSLIGFSGLVSMSKGEVGEIKDKSLAADLIKAGYIEPVEKPKKEKPLKKGE